MKENFMQNRRGDISIIIFVLGVVAICALVILSFFISNNNSKDDFVSVSVVEKVGSLAEEIKFYESLGRNPLEEVQGINEDFYFGDFFIFKAEKNERYLIEGSFVNGDKRILYVKYGFD